MFIQQSQTPHINNTGNVYRNIGNVFKNHITVIEKNYILNYCPALLITYLYIYSNNYIFPILVFLYIEHTTVFISMYVCTMRVLSSVLEAPVIKYNSLFV